MNVALAKTSSNSSVSYSKKPCLVNAFQTQYSVLRASTAELKNESYKLRYRVYCEENDFEAKDQFPACLEFDEYDEYSEHFLVKSVSSNEFVGTVRLIKSSHNGIYRSLPIQDYCSHALSNDANTYMSAPGSYTEISRLAVSKCGLNPGSSPISNLIRAEFGYSLTTIALSYACLAAVLSSSVMQGSFTMMEPRLSVLLSRLGLKFSKVGELTDYHGQRAPYYLSKNKAVSGLTRERLDFLDFVRESID